MITRERIEELLDGEINDEMHAIFDLALKGLGGEAEEEGRACACRFTLKDGWLIAKTECGYHRARRNAGSYVPPESK